MGSPCLFKAKQSQITFLPTLGLNRQAGPLQTQRVNHHTVVSFIWSQFENYISVTHRRAILPGGGCVLVTYRESLFLKVAATQKIKIGPRFIRCTFLSLLQGQGIDAVLGCFHFKEEESFQYRAQLYLVWTFFFSSMWILKHIPQSTPTVLLIEWLY